jgi:hypothetical protein
MVFDLLTLGGFFLFFVMLAALLASHDFRHGPAVGPSAAERNTRSRRRNR